MNKAISNRSRPVAIWLLIGVFMIIVQIILGGITRLTDSGLSITEWKPLLGAIPPTSDAEWQKAFDGYKQIAQFKHIHSYFSLQDFKNIFFWEWLHRNWGRLIGVVFAIPFIIFLLQKRFTKDMVIPMLILFLLGILQARIGWLMVQSGLNDEDLYVSHIRLMIHLIAALVLLVYTLWLALRLLVNNEQKIYLPSSKKWLQWLIALLVIQFIYGAFMAGLKAATYAPTWPEINGAYMPSNLTTHQGKQMGISSLLNNPIAVHFIHRNLAYLLSILIFVWTVIAFRKRSTPLLNKWRWLPAFLVIVQIILGVMAVLTSVKKVPQRWGVFEWNAQVHQVVAMLLLMALTIILFLHTKNKSAAV